LREFILKALYRLMPFDLRGDCREFAVRNEMIKVSCIINFYGRLDLLRGILFSLASQNFCRELFEVILVEDRGGTEAGRNLCESFPDRLQVVYAPLDANFGKMGYSRNFGLSRAQGEVVLFLDDDTVLLQPDFLGQLVALFQEHPDADAVVPRGHASFALVEGRYDYHDPFFMTSRCMAYRRSVLEALGGFMAGFVGQEDVEYVMRFAMAGNRAVRGTQLEYYHPPLLMPNTTKAKAVGASFCQLRGRYPLPVWLLAIVNCGRHAPLMLIPQRRCREMGRFGWGFLQGVWACLTGKREFKYL
jgi:cellulose synthase/poly-beta-1,6-N-acetylglucosamine synthase-like glycosyltransferase